MPSRSFYRSSRVVFAAFLIVALTTICSAQDSAGPQPAPLPAPVAGPVDKPYPGTFTLKVDLTNVNQRVLNVRETIPVNLGLDHTFVPTVASRDAFAVKPGRSDGWTGCHCEWQAHSLGP